MFDRATKLCRLLVLVMLAISGGGLAAQAEDSNSAAWRVSKTSGDVWVTTTGVQKASLTDSEMLRPGDTIRTGRNGRVLLMRGDETIMVSPNSVVGVPEKNQDKQTTTIVQQAGSILLDVEKRNVRHFEVETPYLVAAVKGTQFQVSVKRNAANVEVHRGEVDVADVKSGQHVLVLPGQTAAVSAHAPGLTLSGSGKFNPIQSGEPRRTSVQRTPVPKHGLTAPDSAPNGQQIRALGDHDRKIGAKVGIGHILSDNGVVRITAPLGDVKLNFDKVTQGLARDATAVAAVEAASVKNNVEGASVKNNVEEASVKNNTVWSSGELLPGNGAAKVSSQGNGNTAAGGTGTGNGSGSGSGNSNANGNGNGNAFGQAQGGANGNDGKGKGKS